MIGVVIVVAGNASIVAIVSMFAMFAFHVLALNDYPVRLPAMNALIGGLAGTHGQHAMAGGVVLASLGPLISHSNLRLSKHSAAVAITSGAAIMAFAIGERDLEILVIGVTVVTVPATCIDDLALPAAKIVRNRQAARR